VTGQREFVLVPREPTKEMLEAGWQWAHDENELETWKSMIRAWERQRESELGTESHLEKVERPPSF
jgi:hypothetical protein